MSTEVGYTFSGTPIMAGPTGPFYMGNPLCAGNYDRIRVVATLSGQSTSPLDIAVTLVEEDQSSTPIGLLDTLSLKPGGQVTTVYECPGMWIVFFGTATGAAGTSADVAVTVYGCPSPSTASNSAPAPTPPMPIKVTPGPIKAP